MTSIDRVRIRFPGTGALLGAIAVFGVATAPVQAQESAGDAWFAWFGCWEAVGGPAGALSDASDVCIAPAEDPLAVDLLTVSGGEVTETRTLITDGTQREVEQSGCSGWERSSWSADRQRVYLRSELACEGGARRVTSGVIAMTSPIEWLEVQTVEAGGYPVVRAQRYRQATEGVEETVGLALPQDRGLAIETARTAASEPIGIEDLAEASRELSAEALELYLFELGGTFDVNAETLIAMDDAGVPESAIDLVVALAHPDVFNVNAGARMVGYRPDEPTPAEVADVRDDRYGRSVYGRFYDPYYGLSYYDPYAYGGYYGYSPFGWGGRYGWRSSGPSVIVVEPRDTEPQERGRLVRGRGYTRGGAPASDEARSPSSRSARERIDTSPPSSSRSPAATRSSSSGSSRASTGSSGGRTAKRKGGGGI